MQYFALTFLSQCVSQAGNSLLLPRHHSIDRLIPSHYVEDLSLFS